MASQSNNVVIEGQLLNVPIFREDGHVEATLQNHEEWKDAEGRPQSRENMIGLLALPETQPARLLHTLKPGKRIFILGKLRTTEQTGPRGGKFTKTKVLLRKILLENP